MKENKSKNTSSQIRKVVTDYDSVAEFLHDYWQKIVKP